MVNLSNFIKTCEGEARRLGQSINSNSSGLTASTSTHSGSSHSLLVQQQSLLLFDACKRGDTAQAATLITSGQIDKDARDANGTTPLSYAAHYGQTETVRYLVQTAMANVEAIDHDGDRALHVAAAAGNAAICDVLLQAGAETLVSNAAGLTPRDMARSHNYHAIVAKLDKKSATVLHKACKKGHRDKLVTLIVQHGLDKDSRDTRDCTPLLYACYYGHLDCVKYLIHVGADLEAADMDGDRPLHVACEKGRADIVQFLLSAGAQTNVRNKNGELPVDIAQTRSYERIACMILANYVHHQDNGNNEQKQQQQQHPQGTIEEKKKKRTNQNQKQKKEDALEMDRTLLQRALSEPKPPIHLSAEYVDYLVKNGTYLSKGAFGVVYKSKDTTKGWTFALKMILYPVQNDEDRQFVESSIETEIAALSMARHPSIIRMYGYKLDPTTSKHAILFEFAGRGSVASVLDDESERALFSGTKRLHVLLEVFRAVQYLHQGGAERTTPFLHRDLKSANICLTENYNAKLIDCGLGKLVDENEESVMKTMSSGSRVFGTDGYTCPWYSKGGGKRFKTACDVYSLGIVIMEFITGCLQGNQSSRKSNCLGDFRTRYLENEDEEEILHGDLQLIEDADACAGWESDTLQSLTKLALSCCEEKTKDRPTTVDAIAQLSALVHSEELGNELGSRITSTAGPLKKGSACVRCNCPDIAIQCENNHGLCGSCLDTQVERNLHVPSITCPADRCFCRPYTKVQLEYAVCPQLYMKYKEYSDFQSNLLTLMGKNALQQNSFQDQVVGFMAKTSDDQERLAVVLSESSTKQDAFQAEVMQMMYNSEMNQEQRMLEMSDAIYSNSEQQIELHLKLLREMEKTPNQDMRAVLEMNDRILRGLTHYIAGTKEVCPRWIVIDFPEKKRHRKGVKSFFRSFSKTEAHLYLVCQHSREKLDRPVVLEVTRKWVQQIAPALKFTLIAVKLACAVAGVTLGSIIPSADYADQSEFYSELLTDIGESSMFDSLQKRIDAMAGNGDALNRDALDGATAQTHMGDGQLAKLTESSYKILSEKLLKEKRSWWKDYMKAVMNKDGHVIYVKNKYADSPEYTPITSSAAESPPLPMAAQNHQYTGPIYQNQAPKSVFVPQQRVPVSMKQPVGDPRTQSLGTTPPRKSASPAPRTHSLGTLPSQMPAKAARPGRKSIGHAIMEDDHGYDC